VLLRGIFHILAFNYYNYSAYKVFICPAGVNSCFLMMGSAKGTNKAQPRTYYYLTAIGLTPGGSNAVHIYTQAVPRIHRKEHT
jgi:hypothetical protein